MPRQTSPTQVSSVARYGSGDPVGGSGYIALDRTSGVSAQTAGKVNRFFERSQNRASRPDRAAFRPSLLQAFLFCILAIVYWPESATVVAQLSDVQHDGIENHVAAESHGIARVVFLQELEKLATDELHSSLERLRHQTDRLQNELDQQRESDGIDQPLTIDQADRSEKQKVAEIERNIRLLRDLFAEKARRQAAANSSKMNAPIESEAGPSTSPQPELPDLNLDSAAAQIPEPAPELMVQPVQDIEQSIATRKIVDKVVDPFELGNSLFRIGNLPQALKAYESVPRTKLTAFDRTWLDFLIASCYRGLGDLDRAKSIYRVVQQDKNGVRFVQSANEWLKHLEKRERMIKAVGELTAKSDALVKRAGELLDDTAEKN